MLHGCVQPVGCSLYVCEQLFCWRLHSCVHPGLFKVCTFVCNLIGLGVAHLCVQHVFFYSILPICGQHVPLNVALLCATCLREDRTDVCNLFCCRPHLRVQHVLLKVTTFWPTCLVVCCALVCNHVGRRFRLCVPPVLSKVAPLCATCFAEGSTVVCGLFG